MTKKSVSRAFLGFSRPELVSLLLTVVITVNLLLLGTSVASKAQQEIPRALVAQRIQLEYAQAHSGLVDAVADTDGANPTANVYDHLDRAIANCAALIDGGSVDNARMRPLDDPQRIASAGAICRELEDYRAMVGMLLATSKTANPGTRGEDTQFAIELNISYQKLLININALSAGISGDVIKDAGRLRQVGQILALVVLVVGITMVSLVSHHRRVREGQSQRLATYAALVRSSGDAIITLSLTGNVISWNPGAEALYGYRPDQIVGRSADELAPDDAPLSSSEVWSPVAQGERTAQLETIGKRKDASTMPLAITLSPIMDGTTVQGVSVISRDITERVTREAELATARNEAVEASRLKSEFLATMSHEIRTPLNGVIGLNALLLRTSLDETQHQYAEGVEVAGGTLLSVINDILDFSKLEAGKVEFDVNPFDPQVLLDEVASLVAVPAHLKGLELLAYCGPDLPAALSGDAGRIRQVLLNLAGNAVKFTGAGEIMMSASVVDHEGEHVVIRFEVRDTGIGLAEVGRHRLFESFSQADSSTTRRYGGTGLGLAICQRLVDGMDGQIGVDSELGLGSTFWFTLPLGEAVHADVIPADRLTEVLEGLRVLIVDDNATNRLILLQQLTSWQMVPEAVADGASALMLMRGAAEAGRPYDIAVLDLLMPEMDGLELARRKSADLSLSHTRMIMLTSTAYVDNVELAAAGIGQWCTKPVRTSALQERLTRLMTGTRFSATPQKPLSLTPEVVAGSLGRILVAEDNELNQLVAEGLITMLGFEVDLVDNGALALQAIAARSYSAVMMDCHMPVMDGFEAARLIRAGDLGGARIPIIAMTAGALDEDRERCIAAGMDDFVSKPVTAEGLQGVLARWVSERA